MQLSAERGCNGRRCAAQAVANSRLTAAIVRTGRVEADAPRGGRVELAAQGALPTGATISPTQVWEP